MDYHYIEMVLQAIDDWTGIWDGSKDEPLASTPHRNAHGNTPNKGTFENEIAGRTGLSTDNLNSLFQRWAGINMTGFMQALTLSHTRKRLQETRNLLADSFSETGTQHPFWICCQVRTILSTHQIKHGSETKTAPLTIEYAVHPSPFGDCLLAMSGKEICHLSFVDEPNRFVHLLELQHNWPQARIIAESGESGRRLAEQLFVPKEVDSPEPLQLLIKGTPLQLNVWQALLTIPQGAMICYQDLAVLAGHPTACRAVASAVAANPLSYLIPCHRVIRKSGEIHHYRWGSGRKKAMLGWEACGLRDAHFAP